MFMEFKQGTMNKRMKKVVVGGGGRGGEMIY